MRTPIALLASLSLLAMAGCSHLKQHASSSEDVFVITAHTIIEPKPDEFGGYTPQEDDYTVTVGNDVMKVKYSESQTSTAKPGDFPGSGLHLHQSYHDPDLSQVPQVGTPILKCILDTKNPMHDGSLAIAVQPTDAPCMDLNGDTLHYTLHPNSSVDFSYVNFDIISERARETH
jgi:hypothetical protein